jgi:hypothetical protein
LFIHTERSTRVQTTTLIRTLPSAQRANRKKYLLNNFGIDMHEYDRLYRLQRGVCAICKKPETATMSKSGKVKLLAVDHDHETGEVRGLLCQRCNQGIGQFGEDLERLMSAYRYLAQFKTSHS